jgi:hypothetical protein
MKKIFITLFLIIILSVFFAGFVSAEELLPWLGGDAKSNKDPIFIEMPNDVHQMMPVTVKVYINDELVKKEAQFVEISAGSANPYSLNEKISIDPSGIFRQTMAYSGQSVIEFGFRPSEYNGQSSSVSVTFYKIKKAAGKEWPDTSSADSEFRNYECHIETNKIMCDSKDGCMICNQPLGSARREYFISKSVDSVSPPSRFSFTNIKDSDSNLRDYAPQYEKFTYSKEKTITRSDGSDASMTESYTVELDITNTPYALKDQKEFMYNFLTKQQGMVVTDISAPGGLTGGYAFQGVGYTAPAPNSMGIEYVNVAYELYAEMQPTGSGMMKVTASRATVVPTGGADAEKDAVIKEAKAFASSYTLSKGEVLKSKTALTNTYSIRSNAKPETTETTELSVFGTITDTDSNPLPFIELEATVDGIKYAGRTDVNGDFSILLTGLALGADEEKECKLKVLFNYETGGKQYFKLYDLKNGANYRAVTATKKFTIKEGENYELHLKFDGLADPDLTTNIKSTANLRHYAVIYFNTHQAVDFALKKLNANIDYKLPVEIYVGNTNKDTLYDPSDSSILISSSDAGYGSSNRPKNREYHEFAHHIMYATYGAWPAGSSEAGVLNHDGFLNPNTADSYTEGFAEFIALAIAKENGDKTPEIYASFGSLEDNYKPWDANGKLEEFAVASLLWDMYDSKNEKGDAIALSLEDMWKVIKVNRANFYEYYKAFKTEYPKYSNQIDALFITHGIFEDTRAGNNKYDAGEPWKYTNEAAGQYIYMDMSDNITKLKYTNGLTIGKATNYQRLNRSSAVRVPNAFIKVTDDNVDYYLVKVDFTDAAMEDYEYEIDLREGLLYIQPLPSDVDAVITVKPKSVDYTSSSTFTINSKVLNEQLADVSNDKEYIAEHDFELKATGSNNDVKYATFSDAVPTYEYEGDRGKQVEKNIIGEDDEESEGGHSAIWIFILIIVIISGAFVYIRYSGKPKSHKRK